MWRHIAATPLAAGCAPNPLRLSSPEFFLSCPQTDTLQDSLDEIFSNLSQFKWRE